MGSALSLEKDSQMVINVTSELTLLMVLVAYFYCYFPILNLKSMLLTHISF